MIGQYAVTLAYSLSAILDSQSAAATVYDLAHAMAAELGAALVTGANRASMPSTATTFSHNDFLNIEYPPSALHGDILKRASYLFSDRDAMCAAFHLLS